MSAPQWSPEPGFSSEASFGLELNAETEAEFMQLMRDMLTASNRTAGKVAAYAKLPRSTAYHFVSPKNTRLPKDREQVKAFAQACRLNPIQVNRVLWLWDRLNAAAENSADLDVIDAELVDSVNVPRALTLQDTTPGGVVVHGNLTVHHHQSTDEHAELGQDKDRTYPSRSLLLAVLDDKVRVRHLIVLLTLIAMLSMGLIVVLFPDRAMYALPAIAIIGGTSVMLLRFTYKKRGR
ncbi:hypothetical protein [Amycolatopsis sp. NPDC004625]|uniref:hypothetical protein n=1 Tax=Amycolatopsis sp. NPDC004625 TaxID=3154670 RepID=UPI0033B593EA